MGLTIIGEETAAPTPAAPTPAASPTPAAPTPAAAATPAAATPAAATPADPAKCTTCKDEEKKKKKTWAEEHEKEMKASLAEQKKMLEAKKADLLRNDDATKANLQKFYGSSSEETRQTTLARVDKELALNNEMSKNPSAYFQDAAEGTKPGTYAYVYPNDSTHQIYLGDAFKTAPLTGEDSQAGTLAHEMSHFSDIGGTKDNIYGATGALGLAKTDPTAALNNADSFEYYVEGVR